MTSKSQTKELSNAELYKRCKRYGHEALRWRRRFIGLLPEVARRRLWEERGFASIFEFAAKLAGLSQDQVRLALNLEKRFSDKPSLHGLLVEGEASLNKLARVVSLATVENEGELAEKVKVLSKSALETLVRDEHDFQSQNGLSKPLFEAKSLPGQTFDGGVSNTPPILQFELSEKVTAQLNELHRQGHDVNELLAKLLKERKERIEEQKEELSRETTQTDSRYIPVLSRELLKEEYGEKCAVPSCLRKAEEIHHTNRFSLSRRHDPFFLAPLCRAHHQIAHAIDGRVVDGMGRDRRV